jgi:hypothetical protein
MALRVHEHIIRVAARVEGTQQASVIRSKYPNLCGVTEHSEHVSGVIQCERKIGAQVSRLPTRNLFVTRPIDHGYDMRVGDVHEYARP